MLGKRYVVLEDSRAETRSWNCTSICIKSCGHAAKMLCDANKSYDDTFGYYQDMFFYSSLSEP